MQPAMYGTIAAAAAILSSQLVLAQHLSSPPDRELVTITFSCDGCPRETGPMIVTHEFVGEYPSDEAIQQVLGDDGAELWIRDVPRNPSEIDRVARAAAAQWFPGGPDNVASLPTACSDADKQGCVEIEEISVIPAGASGGAD